MAYTDLFDDTCNNSIGGIKKLYLATRYSDGSPIDFPIDVLYDTISNDENVILLDDDFENRIITINNKQITYRNITPKDASFEQEIIETRQGRIYEKKLSFIVPKITITTNNQIREFLFDSGGQFAISNALALILDNNNNKWIVGFDYPLILDNFDLKTDKTNNGSNDYSFNYTSRSYLPSFKYKNV